MTPDELDKAINSVIKTFKDPVFIASDGSNFDSHQHASSIEFIDNKILRTIRPLLAYMGYT
jgi:hypothetical protein